MKAVSRVLITIFFFITTFGFCELISRYAFKFYPNEIHQRYTLKFKNVKINGRGAIGNPYKGQPFKIAIFGNSTIEINGLSFLLEKELGKDNVHVDNFSRNKSWLESTLAHIKKLNSLNYKYDIIIIGYFYENQSIERQYKNHYSSRWMPLFENATSFFHLHFFHFLKEFEKRRRPDEKYSILIKENKSSSNNDENEKVEQFIQILSQGSDVSDIEFRHSPFVLSRLAYSSPVESFDVNDNNKAQALIAQIEKYGKYIAKEIYWLELRYLWHPRILAGYNKKYEYVLPIPNLDNSSLKFHNLRSLYDRFKFSSNIITSSAHKHGMKSFPFSQIVIDQMPREEDLIIDGIHLSEKGMAYAARYLAEKLKPLVQEKIKN
ncbi:MAG: hypothetical protein OXB84_02370 [Halobacteriovoraceae bacterium]|nr:hypothetical protein [Halobacteriovoraceae bacterium]